MQLRARQINFDGTMQPESLLDVRTCTCCQTSAARTASGDIVAVYRDKYDDVYTVPLSPYINTSTVISDHLRRAAKMRSRERRRQHPRRQLTF